MLHLRYLSVTFNIRIRMYGLLNSSVGLDVKNVEFKLNARVVHGMGFHFSRKSKILE